MRLLTDDEALQWVRDVGLQAGSKLPSTRVRALSTAHRMRLQIPDDALSAVALAYMLALTDVVEYGEEQFAGALLWLQRWEIWSASIDRAGYVLLEGIRSVSGQSVPLGSAPGHLFQQGEFSRAHACLALPMVFQWDAHYIPVSGEFFVFVSHEGYLELTTQNERLHRDTLGRLQQWSPSEGSGTSSER